MKDNEGDQNNCLLKKKSERYKGTKPTKHCAYTQTPDDDLKEQESLNTQDNKQNTGVI